jgi:hypothetical protein
MSRPATTSAIVLAALLAGATCAFAQATPVADTSATAPSAPAALPTAPAAPATPAIASAPVLPSSILGNNSPTPARPHLVMPRTEVVIHAERDQLSILASAADADLLAAKKQRVEDQGTIEIKKREIDTINARVKAAKQAKDDATRNSFEAERKRQESMRDFFTHAQDVSDAAIEEAAARGAYARAGVGADDLELQLVGRAGVASLDADPSIFKLEQLYIETAKQRDAAQEKLASKAQALADRRLRLYRAWADYLGGK